MMGASIMTPHHRQLAEGRIVSICARGRAQTKLIVVDTISCHLSHGFGDNAKRTRGLAYLSGRLKTLTAQHPTVAVSPPSLPFFPLALPSLTLPLAICLLHCFPPTTSLLDHPYSVKLQLVYVLLFNATRCSEWPDLLAAR